MRYSSLDFPLIRSTHQQVLSEMSSLPLLLQTRQSDIILSISHFYFIVERTDYVAISVDAPNRREDAHTFTIKVVQHAIWTVFLIRTHEDDRRWTFSWMLTTHSSFLIVPRRKNLVISIVSLNIKWILVTESSADEWATLFYFIEKRWSDDTERLFGCDTKQKASINRRQKTDELNKWMGRLTCRQSNDNNYSIQSPGDEGTEGRFIHLIFCWSESSCEKRDWWLSSCTDW